MILNRLGKKIKTDYYWFKKPCFLPGIGRDIERLKIEVFMSCEKEYYTRCFVEIETDLFIMHPMMHANVEEHIEAEYSAVGNLIGLTKSWPSYVARYNSCIRKALFLKNVRSFSDIVKKQFNKNRRNSKN